MPYDNYRNQNQQLPFPTLNQIEGYRDMEFSKDGKYDVRFIVQFAKKLSDMFTGRGYKVDRDENKSSQIRKYYEYGRRVETAVKAGQIGYEEASLELNRLRVYVSYARERKKVSNCFQDFIEVNLDRIHGTEDLYFFMKHFEAVIGYSKERK